MRKLRLFNVLALIATVLTWSGIAFGSNGIIENNTNTSAEIWGERADSAQAALEKNFWYSSVGIYYSTSSQGKSTNYWWQAHALDALIMGYRRTRNSFYSGRMSALYAGILRVVGFTDSYYDDMEWMALALLRSYEVTKSQTYLNQANFLWHTVQGGWSNSPGGGGFKWRTQGIYKNVPANAPACILASKLYKDFGDTANLAWAKKIHAWMNSNMVDSTTGIILDGISYTDTVASPHYGSYSYNYGTYLGASLYLYQITGDTSFLDEAVREANVADSIFANSDGILRSEGSGDGGLFNGIYVYYLAKLDLEPALNDSLRTRYKDFLLKNADSLWDYAQSPGSAIFDDDWHHPPSGSVTLSEDLSGVTLLESVAEVLGDTSATAVTQVGSPDPQMFRLSQNFPNPFNPSTKIRVSLNHSGFMTLKVYNILGDVVEIVAEGYKRAGDYTYNVNLDNFASGVYLYSLHEDGNAITRKMLLLK